MFQWKRRPTRQQKKAGQDDRDFRFRGGAEELLYAQDPECLLAGAAGTGKAQPLDAAVQTPHGPRRMGDLKVGDEVCTPSGGVAKVAQIHPQGVRPTWRVTFNCGESVECTEDHLWEVRWIGGGKRGGQKLREMKAVLPLKEIAANYKRGRRRDRAKYWVAPTEPVAFTARPTTVDPYALGLLLGDGSTSTGQVGYTSADPELVEALDAAIKPDFALEYRERYYHAIVATRKLTRRARGKPGQVTWHPGGRKWSLWLRMPGGTYKYSGLYKDKQDAIDVAETHRPFAYSPEELEGETFQDRLRDLGVFGKRAWEKRVPSEYLCGDAATRLAVLQGLMDTDGTVSRDSGMPSFSTTSEGLARDVMFLVESLGGGCTITLKQPKKGKLSYTCNIRYDDNPSLFRLTRKKARARRRTKYPFRRYVTDVSPTGRQAECQCITLDDGVGMYLTDRFVPTHNSVACLAKIYWSCEHTRGIRCLIVRKTRESLNESGLVTLEQKIFPPGHHALKGPMRKLRAHYRFNNGSEIIVGGMDKPSKIMSTEYDLIFCQEATELREEDWEALTTRLRNNRFVYHQILADCNPDAPTHWLKRRCDTGKTRMIVSRHEDNPALYDAGSGQWTPLGKTYLDNLRSSLSGVRLERLLEGKWKQTDGAVYPEWDSQHHLIWSGDLPGGGPFPPPEWRRFWAVDFGMTNPFVCLMAAMDHDGRLYVYREIYRTGVLVEDHAKRLLAMWKEEADFWAEVRRVPVASAEGMVRPEFIVCDHDAEDRATLERHLGMPTLGARKYVRKGIQAVSERLRLVTDGQGRLRPRLCVVRDGLRPEDVDRLLEAARKPTRLSEEVEAYVWNPEKDAPVKVNDHACFVAGTLVMTRRGDVPIEEVRVGDEALTRKGYRRVIDAAMTAPLADVLTVTFSDGRTLTGTGNHPVWSVDAGVFVRLDFLATNEGVIDVGARPLCSTSTCRVETRRAVYNLTVEDAHEYFAGGVLVSNCDALRYMILQIDGSMLGTWEAAEAVSSRGDQGDGGPASLGGTSRRVFGGSDRPRSLLGGGGDRARGGRALGGGA